MKKLTVVMPYLNEGYEPLHTLESMCSTTDPNLFDVIVIDDNSVKQPDDLHGRLTSYKNVELLRNDFRFGLPKCRDLGVKMAKTENILIIDAHMRFRKDDWANKINNLIRSEPKTVWCTVCPRLNSKNLDMIRPRGKYYGANLVLIDKNNEKERPARNILEPKWRTRIGVGFELPCILGANYFFAKKWWEHIRGWEGLQMWGTSEPFVSLKTWMAGGQCKLCTDIEIGHIFRDRAPYVTQIYPLFYNKIFVLHTIIPEPVRTVLYQRLHRTRQFENAFKMILNDHDKIQEHREYYESIFEYPFESYCERFNVEMPKC